MPVDLDGEPCLSSQEIGGVRPDRRLTHERVVPEAARARNRGQSRGSAAVARDRDARARSVIQGWLGRMPRRPVRS